MGRIEFGRFSAGMDEGPAEAAGGSWRIRRGGSPVATRAGEVGEGRRQARRLSYDDGMARVALPRASCPWHWMIGCEERDVIADGEARRVSLRPRASDGMPPEGRQAGAWRHDGRGSVNHAERRNRTRQMR